MKNIFLYFGLVCFPLLLGAQTISKNSVNEFQTGSKAKLIVNTRFAHVYFTGNSDKTIKVETQYRVTAKDSRKAKVLLENALVKVNAKGNTVQVGYDFQSNTEAGNATIETEIRISGPIDTDIDANCMYGNLVVNRTQGVCKLGVRYGLLQVSDLIGANNNIDIAYSSNSSVKSITKTTCEVDYSTVIINTAGSIDLTSKYSSIELSKVEVLKLNSEGDKLNMEAMGSVSGNSKLSSISIDGLSKGFEVESEYGNIEIKQIDEKFSSIQINSKFSQLNLGFAKNANFSFDVNASYGSIKLPQKGIRIVSDIQTLNSHTIKGSIGNGGLANVQIKTTYGNADLHLIN